MDLLKIKPDIILPDFSLNNNFNKIKKNENINIVENIYPDLNNLKLDTESIVDNLLDHNIEINTDKLYNYIYKKKYITEYTEEEIKYKNFFLFNYNEERFFSYGKKLDFDPLIFEDEMKLYPSFVKRIYYTKISPENKIVRLSRLTNIYLNLCFEKQNFASFYRVMYFPLYELMIKKLNIINEDDVKKHFIKNDIINNYGNIEIFYKKENKIVTDINYDHKDIISYDIKDIQPTFWSYKNFYDYIPICFIPPNYYVNLPFLKQYPDHHNIIMSNICFHNNDCHDYWCKTHNYNIKQSINYLHNHDPFQNLYKFNKSQLIDINEIAKL